MSLRRNTKSSAVKGGPPQRTITPHMVENCSLLFLVHGLKSRRVVLEHESMEEYERLLSLLLESYQAVGSVEFNIVEDMAKAEWRLRRALEIEARLIERKASPRPDDDPLDRMAAAFRDRRGTPRLKLLHLYENQLRRSYKDAWEKLNNLRCFESYARGADWE